MNVVLHSFLCQSALQCNSKQKLSRVRIAESLKLCGAEMCHKLSPMGMMEFFSRTLEF